MTDNKPGLQSTQSLGANLLSRLGESGLTAPDVALLSHVPPEVVEEWLSYLVTPPTVSNLAHDFRSLVAAAEQSEFSLAVWLKEINCVFRWLKEHGCTAAPADIFEYVSCACSGEFPCGVEWFLREFGFERSVPIVGC